MTNWLTDKLASFKNELAFEQEKYLLDATRQVCLLMEAKKISRSDLAKKLGVSKPYITELLSGKPNMTVQTMVKLAIALGTTLESQFVEPRATNEAAWRKVDEQWKVRGTLQLPWSPVAEEGEGAWRVFKPTKASREANYGEPTEVSSVAA